MQEQGTKHIEHIQKLCSQTPGVYYCITEVEQERNGKPVEKQFWPSKFYKTGMLDLANHLEIMQKRSQTGWAFYGLLGFTSTNENHQQDNISHFFDMFFDIDNREFKKATGKTEDLRLKTQSDLLVKLINFLGKMKLLDFATIINSGSGLHCHFFFENAIETRPVNIDKFKKLYQIMLYLFWENTKGIYTDVNTIIEANEGEKVIDADPQCIHLTKPTKIFPGTLTRIPDEYKVEISVLMNDAKRYLSFTEFEKIVSEYWEKQTGIRYVNTFFSKVDNKIMCFVADDKADLKVRIKSYSKSLKAKDNSEPKTTDDGNSKIYKNDNDTKVKIQKHKMYFENGKTRRSDAPYRAMQTGFCLYPKYQFEREDHTIFEIHAVNHREVKDIQISTADFDTTQKLQSAFNSQLIDIEITSPIRQILFSYFKTHCEKIQRRQTEIKADYLTHYDFAYNLKTGLLELTDKHFENGKDKYIIDAEFESEMLRNKNFIKPLKKTKLKKIFIEFYTELQKTFLDENICNLYVAFLLSAMRRSDFEKYFTDFPGVFFFGTSQTGKSTLLNIASKIYNINIVYDPTVYNLYRKQKNMQNYIIFIDDMQDINNNVNTVEFLKNSSHYHTRERDRRGKTVGTEFRNSVMITTNYPVTEEALTTRFIKMHITEKIKSNFKQYNKFKEYVNENAFYIFLAMYELMYNLDFEKMIKEIKVLSTVLMNNLQNSRLAEMYSILFMTLIVVGIDIDPSKLINAVEIKEQNYSNDLTNFVEAIIDYIYDKAEQDNQLGFWEEQVLEKLYYIPYTAFILFFNNGKYENFATKKEISKRITSYDFCRKDLTTHKNKTLTYMIIELDNKHFKKAFKVNEYGQMYIASKGSKQQGGGDVQQKQYKQQYN